MHGPYPGEMIYVPKAVQTMKQYKEKKRKYAIWVLAFLLIVLISSMMSAFATNTDAYAADLSQMTKAAVVVTIEPGDTLWSIAAEYGPEDRSIQEFIYEIKKKNGLNNSSIKVGQKIILP